MTGEFTLLLVGAGNMGGAMLAGWLGEGMAPGRITVVDPAPSEVMADRMRQAGIRHMAAVEEGLDPDIAILAVKPQIFDQVASGIRPALGEGTVTVSVAAGITLSKMAGLVGHEAALVRAMPNTPALVRRAVTVACANENTSAAQRDNVASLLASIGRTEWVEDESLMDAVTAVSGSGPAYVFYLTECLAEAGVKAGLSPELAMILARDTVSGAGELMRQASQDPATLRENVTSPQGTTAAALAVLMAKDGLAPVLERAVEAAARRSRELAG